MTNPNIKNETAKPDRAYDLWPELPYSKAALQLQKLVYQLSKSTQDFQLFARRPIVIQPVRAEYGEPNALIIAINGSPPKGILFVQIALHYEISYVVFMSSENSIVRKLNSFRQREVIFEFLQNYFVNVGQRAEGTRVPPVKPYVIRNTGA